MSLQRIGWDEVKESFFASNPLVAAQIDVISENKRPSLYLARYSFGELIVKEGLFHLPENTQISNDMREDITYDVFPVLFNLNRTLEVFLKSSQMTYPVDVLQPGRVFGCWSILDKHSGSSLYHEKILNLAAGCRTIFILPKVTDASSHSKMQRLLNLEDAYPPYNLFDHGSIFKDIAASSKIACNWVCEVLIFGKKWKNQLEAGELKELYQALLQQEWNDTRILRDQIRLGCMWTVLAEAQAKTHLKPNAYAMDTLKHIVNIAANIALGFAPLAEKDEMMAPVASIQNAYLQYYGLKQYIPTLFAPAYLSSCLAVYYSFLSPTLLSLSPNHNFRNTLEDQRNVRNILNLFQQSLSNYPVYQKFMLHEIQFQFFHFEADPTHNILSVDNLLHFDTTLNQFAQNSNLNFAENGPFLRACIRISANRLRSSDNNS